MTGIKGSQRRSARIGNRKWFPCGSAKHGSHSLFYLCTMAVEPLLSSKAQRFFIATGMTAAVLNIATLTFISYASSVTNCSLRYIY
jgi:hypothetical protein